MLGRECAVTEFPLLFLKGVLLKASLVLEYGPGDDGFRRRHRVNLVRRHLASSTVHDREYSRAAAQVRLRGAR